MVFDQIEELKRDYTDKYVVVDDSRPELKRFSSLTGVVKTVNMNGRALVEFDGFENIGWYDIELDFLKVVDKPQPPPEPEKKAAPAKKAAAKSKSVEKSAEKPASKQPTGGGMSVDDILAAARGADGGGAAGGAPAAKSGGTPAAKPPAEKAAPKAAPAAKSKTDTGSMSVEEILAAARGGGKLPSQAKSAAPEAEAAAAPAADPEPPAADPEPDPEPAVEAAAGEIPTDTNGIVAFCRKVDGA